MPVSKVAKRAAARHVEAILLEGGPDVVQVFNRLNLALSDLYPELDDMSDEEYEDMIVELVYEAYEKVGEDLRALTPGEAVDKVKAVLNSGGAKFGWYKGNLPDDAAVARAVNAI